MAKKYAPPSLARLSKLSFSGVIAALFMWVLYVIADHFPHHSQAIILPSTAQPIELYSNQTDDDLSSLYLQAIEQAQHSIVIAIYSLADSKIIQALNQKSNDGVNVYIVGDAKAAKGVWRQIPNAIFIRRIGQGLMHEKILIVDDRQILMGSANLTPSSLHIHGNLVIGLNHAALAEELTNYIKGMDEEGGNVVSPPHSETTASSQHVELWMLPNEQDAVQRLIQFFRSAKKSIKVAMFTWTREDFAKEMIAAAKRGVKVQIVIDRYAGKGAGAKVVRLLEAAKLSVRLSTGQGLLHHKFAYIDDSILVNGSANWTMSAFKTNDDGFLIIYPLTPIQQKKMNSLWDVIESASSIPKMVEKTTDNFKGKFDD